MRRGHRVLALARPGSETRIPAGASLVTGDALDGDSFAAAIPRGATFVHLTGVSHPSPAKARQFREIDFESLRTSVAAAHRAGVRHFVYVSVAHPAPVMKVYWGVRAECEEILRREFLEAEVAGGGRTAAILRPWYVLGPGHRWAYALVPLYAVCGLVPSMAATTRRIGLVRLDEMLGALVAAVERPPASGARVVEVPEIRRSERMR